MQARRWLVRFMAAGALALAAPFALSNAVAQNEARFTIRRPPDGATVREKVRVEIPIASIPEGGYVAYSIDGQFRVALTPTEDQRAIAYKPGHQMFVYVWDTKQPMKVRGSATPQPVADGEHEVSATLYAPKSGPAGGSTAKQTSSVKVTVANKVNADPGAVLLRYRFPDSTNRTYLRSGDTSIVTGLTQGMQGTGDQELVAQNSKLLLSVEDVYGGGSAIVRNKLTSLKVRQNGQETTYPEEQLPQSLYQQLDPLGRVLYQNQPPSFDEFAALGIPVDTTIDLPLLPSQPVRIGDKWETPGQKLDIPGTAPDKQPKVTLTSTLEDIEWEGGYPTARIHQTYDSSKGGLKQKSLTFGTIEVLNPQLKYDRNIYLAYRSGTLVKVDRKLEVTGKTTQVPAMGGMAGGMGGPGGMMGPGMSGGPMMGGRGPMGGPSMGGSGMSGGPTGPGRMGPGMMGGPYGGGMMSGGRGRRGGMMGSGMMGGSGMSGGPTGPGRMGPGMMGGPYGGGAPYGGGYRGPGQQEATSQITLKSTTNTELQRG